MKNVQAAGRRVTAHDCHVCVEIIADSGDRDCVVQKFVFGMRNQQASCLVYLLKVKIGCLVGMCTKLQWSNIDTQQIKRPTERDRKERKRQTKTIKTQDGYAKRYQTDKRTNKTDTKTAASGPLDPLMVFL